MRRPIANQDDLSCSFERLNERYRYDEPCGATGSFAYSETEAGFSTNGEFEILCAFHSLVRELMTMSCDFCSGELVGSEENAIDLVRELYPDGPPGDPEHELEDVFFVTGASTTCDHCTHILTKDD